MFGIIYKVTNKINGKCYIGETVRPLNIRKNHHKYSVMKNEDNSYFHSAIRKYGWDNFEWEMLCECNTREELDNNEIYFINFYKSHWTEGYGYNLTKGGCGMSGFKFTKETCAKISKGRKGKCIGKPSPMKGKVHSEEARKRMGEKKKKYMDEIVNVALQYRKNGLMYKEISKIINVPIPTIKWWQQKSLEG